MQLKQTVNVFIGMNPTTFYIPLLNVKRLSPSLIKLFSSWFNKKNNSKYLPTVAEKLFGMLHNENDKKLSKFNCCLLFAKYILYCQKLSSKKCDFNEFNAKLLLKLRVENLL